MSFSKTRASPLWHVRIWNESLSSSLKERKFPYEVFISKHRSPKNIDWSMTIHHEKIILIYKRKMHTEIEWCGSCVLTYTLETSWYALFHKEKVKFKEAWDKMASSWDTYAFKKECINFSVKSVTKENQHVIVSHILTYLVQHHHIS